MTSWHFVQRFGALLALLAAPVICIAQMTPAHLGSPDSENYFLKLIPFPETHGDATVNMQCQTIVKTNGRLDKPGCYIQNNWEPPFAEAVTLGGKKAEFVPAMDGDKPRKVGFLFQIQFVKKGDDHAMHIFLNSALEENIEEYGQDHLGAQRAMGKENWSDKCPKRKQWVAIARAHVDEMGVASSVDLVHGSGIIPPSACQEALVQLISSSKFAPASVDGVPVPSTYVEPFGN